MYDDFKYFYGPCSLFLFGEGGRGGGAVTLLNIWDVLWDCTFRLTYFCYIYHHWLRLMIKSIPDYMIVLRLKLVLHSLVSIKRPELKSNKLFRFNFLKVKTLYIDIWRLFVFFNIRCIIFLWNKNFYFVEMNRINFLCMQEKLELDDNSLIAVYVCISQ